MFFLLPPIYCLEFGRGEEPSRTMKTENTLEWGSYKTEAPENLDFCRALDGPPLDLHEKEFSISFLQKLFWVSVTHSQIFIFEFICL